MKFIGHFENLIEEENKRGINLRKEDNPEYAFSLEDNINEKMDINELLNLNGRRSRKDDEHLKVIHQIKLNMGVEGVSRLYYYKRWVWMNFPWICQHGAKKSFGQLVDFFEAQETRLGSVYMQCLGIIYLNKFKKESVFNSKPKQKHLMTNLSQMTECKSTW